MWFSSLIFFFSSTVGLCAFFEWVKKGEKLLCQKESSSFSFFAYLQLKPSFLPSCQKSHLAPYKKAVPRRLSSDNTPKLPQSCLPKRFGKLKNPKQCTNVQWHHRKLEPLYVMFLITIWRDKTAPYDIYGPIKSAAARAFIWNPRLLCASYLPTENIQYEGNTAEMESGGRGEPLTRCKLKRAPGNALRRKRTNNLFPPPPRPSSHSSHFAKTENANEYHHQNAQTKKEAKLTTLFVVVSCIYVAS